MIQFSKLPQRELKFQAAHYSFCLTCGYPLSANLVPTYITSLLLKSTFQILSKSILIATKNSVKSTKQTGGSTIGRIGS